MSIEDQQTPLLTQLEKFLNRHHAPFYAPGHKQGKGASLILQKIIGTSALKADLPELPELDNLFAPQGVIKQAQENASKTFKAQKTWFLINGSTSGIIASILATCQEGDKIILPRNIHQSAIFGLVLSGAIPIFIHPEYNPIFDIFNGISPQQIKTTLQQNPDAKAVLIVSPTYQGICSNIRDIATITHQYNIPLLVDEAHGAHFSFHPQLPPSAMESGADIAIQSTHKVLGALTQASMLHLQGNLVDPNLIQIALQLVQSSSPSYLLLASLESATVQMAREGKELLDKTIDLALFARQKIKQVGDYLILENNLSNCYDLDVTRLTINVTNLGIDGYLADEILHEKLAVTCELPSLTNLTFIISIGNSQNDLEKLILALKTLKNYQDNKINSPLKNLFIVPSFVTKISPRQAFWAKKTTVTLANSVNQVSGETICPYPPGIPLIMAGEVISQDTLHYLKKVIKLGGIITGAKDSTLKTIQVILSLQ